MPFAMYMKEDHNYAGYLYRSRILQQWPSHAEPTHTIHHICSKIDSKSWTPNKSLHISYIKCVANNSLVQGAKKYDELADIELNVDTFLKMLNYSATTLEVIELYVFNKNHSVRDFFYSIIFDKFRYKLKGPLDIDNIVHVLAENSKLIKNITIDIVDEYCAVMQALVKSREQLESVTLLDANVGDNFTLDNMPSTLKYLSLVHGEFKASSLNTNLSQLETISLRSFEFKDLNFMNSAKNLVSLKIFGNDRDKITISGLTCMETLQNFTLEFCSLSDADLQFLKQCKQLKNITYYEMSEETGDRIIHGFLNLPTIEKLVLHRGSFDTLSPCNTLRVLHLNAHEWYVDEEVLTRIFELMPNLRFLKVSQDTELTKEFTGQTYKLMKSVLSNSDLTFIMYKRTLNNYGAGDIIVVDKHPSKLDCISFEFESTFFLDFFPNHDVFEPFKASLQEDGLNYHIKCMNHDEYDYKNWNE